MSVLVKLVAYKVSGIYIEVKNDGLFIKGRENSITDDLKADLMENKSAILNFYKELGIKSNKQLAPSSFSQQRLWFLEMILEGSSNYNMVECLPFHEAMDIDALSRALSKIVYRHWSLRTTYIESAGVVYQVVNDNNFVLLEVYDYRNFPYELACQKMQDVISNSSDHVFKLDRDLMVKADLCRIRDNENYLIVNVHHIASDGWSQGIFRKELKYLYRTFCINKTHELPRLNYQFVDYAHWERNFLTGSKLSEHLEYWRNNLKDIPEVHNLPLDSRGQAFKHIMELFTMKI